jgi:hypothetical protein
MLSHIHRQPSYKRIAQLTPPRSVDVWIIMKVQLLLGRETTKGITCTPSVVEDSCPPPACACRCADALAIGFMTPACTHA